MNTRKYILSQENLTIITKPLAKILKPGMTIALWGDLGAGKTTFSRSLLQEILGNTIEIPSPTFTLVQVYDTQKGEIWHCDLYRLKNPSEIFELGLEDAFHTAICVIEWPQNLGDFLPMNRVDISLKIVDESTREITVTRQSNDHDSLGEFL
jgi:tRNA threonylcarbamoyladenosine biosynthesis protein TsaE